MGTGRQGENRERGASFVELMVAIAIVGMALMVMLSQISISFREASMNEHRAFGYRKAMAILTEIHNGVERGDIVDAMALDRIADLSHNVSLTTLADGEGLPLPPHHPMSNNRLFNGLWEWSRVVEIEAPPMQPQLRYVRVKVYRVRESGGWDLQATVGELVSVPAATFQPTKYYDVYVLALAETPSLWLPLGMARMLIENARLQVETIDNGLKMRVHWITRNGFGRDPVYAPFLNEGVPATSVSPDAYFYPGRLTAAGGDLFMADFFSGRLRTEEGIRNGYDAADNPVPHAIADRNNHCMRLPEARTLFEARVAAGVDDEKEPPLQLLLEDLWSDPEKYRNALFVNLHGTAIPMPPLRNYADAAKNPVAHPGVRVVAHPEKLRTERNATSWSASANPVWRVYGYKSDPEVGPAVLSEPITLQIHGVDLTGVINGAPLETLQIRRLPGGIDPATGEASGTGRDYLPFGNAPSLAAASQPHEMSYEVGYVGGAEPYTWIKLHNTPLVTPPVDGRGLDPAERLYGMDYVPSPVDGAANAFSADLATVGGSGVVKNTARWEIELPAKLLDPGNPKGLGGNEDQVVSVVTRIGHDFGSGAMWPTINEPHNLSRSYTWWAASPDAVPRTERYQFQGDPRHNPYADLMNGGGSFANGYNWHFDNLREPLFDASTKWPGLDASRLQDGFGAGSVADVPRFLQLLRGGLQNAGCVFINPCGVLAQQMLLGGEVALPGVKPGSPPNPVVVGGSLVGSTKASELDSVSPTMASSSVCTGQQVVVGTGSDPFWSKEWLGELAPDTAYSIYLNSGNLPTGSLPGTYHLEPRCEAMLTGLPAGTDFGFPAGAVLGIAGGVAMVDSGTLVTTFRHVEEAAAPPAEVTAASLSIAKAVGDPLPAKMPSVWPFGVAMSFPGALPYFNYTTDYPKSSVSILEDYYNGIGELSSSATLAVEAPTSLASAFFNVVALSPATPAEHASTALASLMLGLRTFHRAGDPTVSGRVVQQPLIELIQPTDGAVMSDPSTIQMRWKTSFVRFDGDPFTEGYPSGFSEDESDLVYSVLYSRDDGMTWKHASDSTPATPGERPAPGHLLTDTGVGNETYFLPTPAASYVGAEYLIRVDCYHKTRLTHLTTHQVRVMITR